MRRACPAHLLFDTSIAAEVAIPGDCLPVAGRTPAWAADTCVPVRPPGKSLPGAADILAGTVGKTPAALLLAAVLAGMSDMAAGIAAVAPGCPAWRHRCPVPSDRLLWVRPASPEWQRYQSAPESMARSRSRRGTPVPSTIQNSVTPHRDRADSSNWQIPTANRRPGLRKERRGTRVLPGYVIKQRPGLIQ